MSTGRASGASRRAFGARQPACPRAAERSARSPVPAGGHVCGLAHGQGSRRGPQSLHLCPKLRVRSTPLFLVGTDDTGGFPPVSRKGMCQPGRAFGATPAPGPRIAGEVAPRASLGAPGASGEPPGLLARPGRLLRPLAGFLAPPGRLLARGSRNGLRRPAGRPRRGSGASGPPWRMACAPDRPLGQSRKGRRRWASSPDRCRRPAPRGCERAVPRKRAATRPLA